MHIHNHFHNHNHNPIHNHNHNLDMKNLSECRAALCLSFAQKCAKNQKTAHMFPKNEKVHNMETRQPETYKVQHANAERLRKSSIIYMTHLLNET